MNKSEKYPRIDNLLGAYFNPDWDSDYDTSEEVIEEYLRTQWKKEVIKTIIEFKELLKEEHSKEEWEKIVYEEFGCGYYFDYVDDYTPRGFLEWILMELEAKKHLSTDIDAE